MDNSHSKKSFIADNKHIIIGIYIINYFNIKLYKNY